MKGENRNKIVLSIIIPAYNCEQHIDKCITELACLNSSQIQIIIVNDGSSDNTAKRLFDLKQKNAADNMTVLSQDNKGVSAARNLGMKFAKGQFVTFYDADDILITGKFDELLDKLCLLPKGIDFYMSSYIHSDGENEHIINAPIESGVYDYSSGASQLLYDLLDNKFASRYESHYIGGKVYQYYVRREFLEKCSIKFPEQIHFAEDLCYCVQLMKAANEIYIDKECYYKYMVYDQSASHRYRKDFWNELKTVYEEISKMTTPKNQLLYSYLVIAVRHYIEYEKNYSKLKKMIEDILNDNMVQLIDCDKLFSNWTPKEKIINFCIDRKMANTLIFAVKMLKC